MSDKILDTSALTLRSKAIIPVLSLGIASALFFTYAHRKRFFSNFFKKEIKKKIYVISNLQQWNQIHHQLKSEAETLGAVGFDCEWSMMGNSGHKEPVGLIQLSSYSGLCALIRISLLKSNSGIPNTLKEILGNENIIKSGVAIADDQKYLLSDHNLKVRGTLDLRELENIILKKRNKSENKMGLQALAKRHLGKTLNKDWHIRGGNWNANTLSKEQTDYAADDAWVGLELLRVMVKELNSSSYALFPSISAESTSIKEICRGHLNIPYRGVSLYNGSSLNNDKKQKKGLNQLPIKPKGSRQMSYSHRKTPLYHNSQLLAPDGETLCVCDPSKAYWYVSKGLGELVSEEPLAVRLKFEPAGRPNREGPDGQFYLQDRQNQCVVCGKEDSYIRKNIVPHEYRKHFPSVVKAHQSHDVVLLCVDCHQESNIKDSGLRYEFSEKFDAPLGCETDIKFSIDKKLKMVRNAAGALNRNRDKLPRERIDTLETILKDFYKCETLSENQIESAADMDVAILNEEYAPHGFKVYLAYKKIGLCKLEVKWRQWFLETMNPQFMPENWSTSHNHEKLKLKMSRYPIDDPIREDYKEALVGTEGYLDIPYIPQAKRSREEDCPSPTTSSREPSPESYSQHMFLKDNVSIEQ